MHVYVYVFYVRVCMFAAFYKSAFLLRVFFIYMIACTPFVRIDETKHIINFV